MLRWMAMTAALALTACVDEGASNKLSEPVANQSISESGDEPRDLPGGTAWPATVAFERLDYPKLASCGLVNSSDWKASIEQHGTKKILLVEGEVGTNPNVDMRIEFSDAVLESYPVQRHAKLIVKHPPGANIDRLDLHRPIGRFAYTGDLGVLNLACDGVLLATIRDPKES